MSFVRRLRVVVSRRLSPARLPLRALGLLPVLVVPVGRWMLAAVLLHLCVGRARVCITWAAALRPVVVHHGLLVLHLALSDCPVI